MSSPLAPFLPYCPFLLWLHPGRPLSCFSVDLFAFSRNLHKWNHTGHVFLAWVLSVVVSTGVLRLAHVVYITVHSFFFFPERCSTAWRDRRLFVPHYSGPPGLYPVFDVTKKVGYMAPHICQNPQKNTTKSDPDVNYGFGVMTGHCRFISCNKCPIWWGC